VIEIQNCNSRLGSAERERERVWGVEGREMGLSYFACFDGGRKQQRREEERLASAEARAKAAEAAQKR